jgi:hypothetical protein
MSTKYKFLNPDGVYFVSFATVYWVDIFTRNEYRDIVINSLTHCMRFAQVFCAAFARVLTWAFGLAEDFCLHAAREFCILPE